MASRLYGIVWRWHFLVGIVAIPIVVVIALSGALYAFEPELGPLIDERIALPHTASPAKPLDDLLDLAEGPACTPTGMYVASKPDRVWFVYCAEGEENNLLVDPYRGEIVAQNGGHTWMDIVFHIHWELMLGDKGRLVIEWGTSCTVVLLLTGVYLWWPRGKRRGGGVWWPRRELKARQWLRDLHAVIGAYLLPIMFIVAATGLMWTIHAGGDRWDKIARDAVLDVAMTPPKSKPSDKPRLTVSQALAATGFDRATDGRAIYFSLPGKDKDAAYNFYIYDDTNVTPWVTQSFYVDAYSGEILRVLAFEDRGMLGKVDTLRYSLHIGSILSLPGRIAVFTATLALVAMCITGPWMWWKRRAKGSLGMPPRAKRLSWPLWVGLAALGFVMPMFGYTLGLIVIVEGIRYGVRWWSGRNVGTHP